MADAKGGMDQDFANMGIDPAQYEALEKDFQEVLQELVGDSSMETFRKEYEKLHRALKTSYESEKRLVRRCKELNDTIIQNTAKVKGAIKLTQEDSNTIAVLRREIEKCWKLVETAKDKEEKARKIIQSLKEEIAKLHKIVEDGSGLSLGNDNQVSKLVTRLEELQKEVDSKKAHIDDLELSKTTLSQKIAQNDSDLIREKEETQKKQHQIEKLEEEQVKYEREKKLYDEKEKKSKEEAGERDGKIKNLEERLQQKTQQLDEKEQNYNKLDIQKQDLVETNKQLKYSHQELQKSQQQDQREKNKLIDQIQKNTIEINQFRNKLREVEKQKKEFRIDNVKLTNDKDRITRQKNDAETEKNITKQGVNALTREIEYLRKQTESEKTDILNLIRDRDMMQKYIKKAEDENEKSKNEIARLLNDIAMYKEQGRAKGENIANLLKQIYRLEKERDKFSQDASRSNANLMQMVEEVKLKQNLISELKKENIEFEAKLKQQQNLYEAVRSDRNLYSKNLIEAQDEVADMRRKFGIASHQITQLKDEILTKDQALSSEIYEKAEKDKDIQKLQADLKNKEKLFKKSEEHQKQLKGEISKLQYVISQMADEIEKIKKDYANVVNERDILGTQLIRRNDELALLYEKIKILQSTLARGEVQYQERLEDIRLLKFKIGDHKSELRIVKSQASQIPDLRKEIYNLQQQLLTERLQVKALSEELENPLNTHRWRRLEGTDPDTWEMLQKIQTLQKRLIKKTEQVVEKDVHIQEKEKLYVELKNLLARQPGPEVAEQLSIYQQNLKEKTSQMKAMAAELNMYQAQVNEYKYEIERLTRELQDMKRKYYEQKRREQMQREAQQRLEPRVIHQPTAPVQRFTGGGFNLAI